MATNILFRHGSLDDIIILSDSDESDDSVVVISDGQLIPIDQSSSCPTTHSSQQLEYV